jgi:hypothetical protein
MTLDERLAALTTILETLSVNADELQDFMRKFDDWRDKNEQRMLELDRREREGRHAIVAAMKAYLERLD